MNTTTPTETNSVLKTILFFYLFKKGMSTDFNFQELRKVFTHKRVKHIINIYNNLNPNNQVDISSVWQRNYHTLINLLKRTGYKGELIGDYIIKHFNEFTHNQINNQINKNIDDELFDKLNEIRKEEQRLDKNKQDYMNMIKERARNERQRRLDNEFFKKLKKSMN